MVEFHLRLLDGRKLGIAEYGDPSGWPLLYFHGGLSCRLDVGFADALCREAGVRMIAPDRPGIGASDHDPDRTLRHWPATMAGLADELGIDRFAVLGWSAGGAYALACAHDIPHRLTCVATAGGMAPIDGAGAVRELGLRLDRILFPLARSSPGLARTLLRLIARLPPRVLRWSLLRELTSPQDRDIVRTLDADHGLDFIAEALRPGPEGTLHDYRVVGGAWGFELGDVALEVDLWQGDEDRLLPMRHAERLASGLPAGRLRVLPGRGHFLLRSSIGEILAAMARRCR